MAKHAPQPVAPFDYVVFGGTGDLSLRKLLPSLYLRDRDHQITPDSRIVALGRTAHDRPAFLAQVEAALHRHLPAAEIEPEAWERFAARLTCLPLDASSDTGWDGLVDFFKDAGDHVRAFYLATSPSLFGPISQRLGRFGLVTASTRVVLEKPIGRDLASARAINDAVGTVFAEHQIYRIDHYLGKETVQNLLALRFANSLFEPLWNAHYIDHVQITVAETVGVEGRGEYYNKSGALRDMVQNHLLQLLCLVAMEPPASLEAEAVHNEKLKVLKALKPIAGADVSTHTVRGQYRAGASGGAGVPGYLEEAGTDGVNTETFVALRVDVDNWRWSGVPFYLRTGKRLPTRVSEIVIQFRGVPHSVFGPKVTGLEDNRLEIRLQPDESIRLHMMTKEPGPGGMRLRPATLNLSFAETFGARLPDAYERLLMDVVRGNSTLFMRRDEVEAAWIWAERILDGWRDRKELPKPYIAGTWGPSAAVALIERDHRTWHEDGDA